MSLDWRSRTPHATIDAYGAIVDAVGTVRIADLTGLDRLGIPIHMAVRPDALSYAIQMGKGATFEASFASAMMESIELWHAERPACSVRVESYARLQEESSQNLLRVAPYRSFGRFSWSRFRPDLEIEWTQASELGASAPIWVPFELVHARYASPLDRGANCFARTTTGLASGNSKTEATIHGITEVVERDAATMWAMMSARGRMRSLIDMASIDSMTIVSLCDQVAGAGLSLELYDMTSELGVAAVRAAVTDSRYGSNSTPYYAIGYGCHPFREVAVVRAITEAAQSRIVTISGARDNIDADHFEQIGKRPTEYNIRDPSRAYSDLPDCPSSDHQSVLAWLKAKLQGFPILVVDLAVPHLAVPVVRVIIPGLDDGLGLPGYVPGTRALSRSLQCMVDDQSSQ